MLNIIQFVLLLFVVLPLGQLTIAGIDYADIKNTDPFRGNSRKAWKGRALVVIKSNRNSGDIKLEVSSLGLADAETDIKSIIKKN